MARIRTIKPAFFRSITMTELPIATRMTFIGLWTYVDDAGRGVDDARLVKAELWPLDDDYTVRKVESDLQTLERKGLIVRYSVGTRTYLAVTNWGEHQKINRPQESSLPAPCGFTEGSVNDHGTISDGSLLEGKGREGNRKGREGATTAPERFEITPHLKDWATKGGYDSVHLEAETENFLDHHASKGSKFVDWDRAWQKWIRTADGWAKERGGGKRTGQVSPDEPNAPGGGDMFASEDERLAAYGPAITLPGEA